jgi:hypothetical protein
MNRTTRLWATSLSLGLLVVAWAPTIVLRAAEIAVVTSPEASSSERVAVQDLVGILRTLHPRDRFVATSQLPAAGQAVLVGSASDRLVRPHLNGPAPNAPESFVVRRRRDGALELGVIAGADPRGTVYGVYALLGKLGGGFHLTGDALPPVRDRTFHFDGWELADQPLVAERLVFNWHNFLSGCSTWNLEDWNHWTDQSQKMGYNAIMVHAYGNNPMAEFSFQGIAKPVGFLSTTLKGRDWSTQHVTDVRRLHGGEVFSAAAFGADAGLVADAQRVTAAQSLMRDVFADAARRDMGVYFAVDVDTPSANPQELVRLLPESARFQASGATSTMTGSTTNRPWLPNPDTPEGYAFFRAQVEGLLKAYPQITKLVVWFRRDGTPWVTLKAADLPASWQREFAAEIARTPEAGRFWHAPGLFAVSKIVRAFDRALQEGKATKTGLAAGTWGFEFLPAVDRFFPSGVPLIGLDYDVIHEKPQLRDAASRLPLREIGAHRPVIPVVWAHHDDGHYIGPPYTPLPEFASKLDDANAAGFGIIHWTTRPLDLYFSSLARQVWKSTQDQPLRETCGDVAEDWFGSANRAVMGEYLESWITGAPRFGRDTTDWFIDRRLTNISAVVTGCRARLAMIDQVRTTGLLPEQRQRLDYQGGLEEFIAAFHIAHGHFQDSQDMLKKGDVAGARTLIAQCHPEPVIELFARFSSIGGITRGEQGLVVSLNTRWLSHIVRHRQALGLEPVRIKFAPTSHDMLAQARGTFTFHFGPDHELWECWGEEETGAAVLSLPRASVSTKDASAPAAWSEVGRTGIEINKPLQLALRPIMAASNRGKEKAASLTPGAYRLHLLVLDPDSTGPGQRVFEVRMVDLPADRVDVFSRAGRTNRVVDLDYPVALKSAGAVEVTLTPVKGTAILCGAVLEPAGSTGRGESGTEPAPKQSP